MEITLIMQFTVSSDFLCAAVLWKMHTQSKQTYAHWYDVAELGEVWRGFKFQSLPKLQFTDIPSFATFQVCGSTVGLIDNILS